MKYFYSTQQKINNIMLNQTTDSAVFSQFYKTMYKKSSISVSYFISKLINTHICSHLWQASAYTSMSKLLAIYLDSPMRSLFLFRWRPLLLHLHEQAPIENGPYGVLMKQSILVLAKRVQDLPLSFGSEPVHTMKAKIRDPLTYYQISKRQYVR